MSSDISNVEFYNNYLLKRSMGIVSSGANVAFYDEHLIGKDKFSKHLLNENIPSSLLNYDANVNYDVSGVHYDTTWSSSVFTENGLQRSYSAAVKNAGTNANKSFGEIFPDSNIEMYKQVYLEPYRKITGTNNRVWAAYDADGNNLLEDAINYNFANDGSYLPILEYNTAPVAEFASNPDFKQINMFTDPLFWLLDDVNGTVTFFNSDASLNAVNIQQLASVQVINKAPRLTFYRYIGDRGFDNLDMSGNIKVTGTLEVSDDTIIRDKLDVSGVDVSNNLIVSGNVGIGTDTPSSKLDVNGSIISSGNIEFDTKITGKNSNVYFYHDTTAKIWYNGTSIGLYGDVILNNNYGTKVEPYATGKKLGTDGKRWEMYATSIDANSSISCTSLNAGSGTIQTTGQLIGGSTTINGDFVGLGEITAGNGSGTMRLNVHNGYGYLYAGPASTDFCHFYTDRDAFYFNKPIEVNGDVIPYVAGLNLGESGGHRYALYATTINANSSISCTSLNAGSGTIQTTGNVGIGHAVDNNKLSIKGALNITPISGNSKVYRSGNTMWFQGNETWLYLYSGLRPNYDIIPMDSTDGATAPTLSLGWGTYRWLKSNIVNMYADTINGGSTGTSSTLTFNATSINANSTITASGKITGAGLQTSNNHIYDSGGSYKIAFNVSNSYTAINQNTNINGNLTCSGSVSCTSLTMSGALSGATTIGCSTINAGTVNTTNLSASVKNGITLGNAFIGNYGQTSTHTSYATFSHTSSGNDTSYYSLMATKTSCYLNGHGQIYFRQANTYRMMLESTGLNPYSASGFTLGTTSKRWVLNASTINASGEIKAGYINLTSYYSLDHDPSYYFNYDNTTETDRIRYWGGGHTSTSIYGPRYFSSGYGFITISDKRVKYDISDISKNYCLDVINSIEIKKYKYKNNRYENDFEYGKSDDYTIGFIAQNVLKYLPQAVKKPSKDMGFTEINIKDVIISHEVIDKTLFIYTKILNDLNEKEQIITKNFNFEYVNFEYRLNEEDNELYVYLPINDIYFNGDAIIKSIDINNNEQIMNIQAKNINNSNLEKIKEYRKYLIENGYISDLSGSEINNDIIMVFKNQDIITGEVYNLKDKNIYIKCAKTEDVIEKTYTVGFITEEIINNEKIYKIECLEEIDYDFKEIFVIDKIKYGNILTLKKDVIFAVHHGAIQEHNKMITNNETEIETLKTENESLKTEVASLKSTLDSVLARLSALESSN